MPWAPARPTPWMCGGGEAEVTVQTVVRAHSLVQTNLEADLKQQEKG